MRVSQLYIAAGYLGDSLDVFYLTIYKLEILRRHQNYESEFLLPAAV